MAEPLPFTTSISVERRFKGCGQASGGVIAKFSCACPLLSQILDPPLRYPAATVVPIGHPGLALRPAATVVCLDRPGLALYPAATVVPTGRPRFLVTLIPHTSHIFVRICSRV